MNQRRLNGKICSFVSIFTLFTSCYSTNPSSFKKEPYPADDDMKYFFDTQEIYRCQKIDPGIQVNGVFQKAELLWDGVEAAIVYQYVNSNGIRLVYQTVDDSFKPKSPGVFIGPDKAQVTDFQMIRTEHGVWATYRYFSKGRFIPMIEYIPQQASPATPVIRFTIETPQDWNAEKIWIFPRALTKGTPLLDVVVSGISQIRNFKENIGSTYIWYLASAKEKKSMEIKRFEDPQNEIVSIHFESVAKIQDPIALLSKNVNQQSFIQVSRPFSSEKPYVNLAIYPNASAQDLIAKRVLEPQSQKIIYSWLLQDEKRITPLLQWGIFDLKSLKKPGENKEKVSLFQKEMRHEPVFLKIVQNFAGSQNKHLTWWAFNEEYAGILTMNLNQQKIVGLGWTSEELYDPIGISTWIKDTSRIYGFLQITENPDSIQAKSSLQMCISQVN